MRTKKLRAEEKTRLNYNYEVILRPRRKHFKVLVRKTKKKPERRKALYLLSVLFVGDFLTAKGEVGTVVSPSELKDFLLELRYYWKLFKETICQLELVKEVEDE